MQPEKDQKTMVVNDLFQQSCMSINRAVRLMTGQTLKDHRKTDKLQQMACIDSTVNIIKVTVFTIVSKSNLCSVLAPSARQNRLGGLYHQPSGRNQSTEMDFER